MHKLPLASFAVAGLLFCGAPALAQSTTSETTEPAVAAAALTSDTVLVVVDGTVITLGEVIAVRQSLPEQYQQLPDEVLMAALVQQMSDQQLLANAASAAGLKASTTVKLALRNQERAVLADAYMAKALLERVDEQAIQTAYDERYANAGGAQEVRAAHILVETEAEANDLKAQMDAGADFAALAAEHGTDGTASRGGDLGWFVKEQMVPEFADAAFGMEPGAVSAPVKSPFGWHLIKLNEKRDQQIPPLAEVLDEIVGELTESAQRAIVEDLRASGTVDSKPLSDVPDSAVREDGLIVE